MSGKAILTPAQRTALFDPPSELATIERLYTLGSEELAEIFWRRRPANRIGFAVQLCYLREPGRALRVDETPPIAMLALLAEQLACTVNDFSFYADRSPTLREHRAQAEAWLGMRPFQIPDRRTLFDIAINVAASTDRGEAIVMEMVRAMRENNVTLPASDTFERIALVARARARKSAYAGIAQGLSAQQKDNLVGLLGAGTVPGRTTLTWLREYPEAPSAGNLAAVIHRLEVARGLTIETDRARTIHANRYAVMAREAAIMSAQHLSRLDDVRRTATLCAFVIEMEVALTDAAVFMVEKMIGSMFRRAERTRSERLVEEAGRLKEIGKVYAALGRLLIEGRWKPEDPRDAIDREIGWPIIERSVHETELLTSGGEDGLEDVLERYPMVRRFAPSFLAAFSFRAAKPGDPVLAAISVLNDMYSSNRRTLPPNVPLGFLCRSARFNRRLSSCPAALAIWGPGTGSSSDGQFYRAGAKGEARADYNAKYGSGSGVLFYTHASDRYIPFHNKVIAANAGEAAHVIDGLLDHESQLDIKEHATDTAGAVDHVFGLCHLLGFRFAPHIRDLSERRLYTLTPSAEYAALRQLIGGPINVKAIEDDWKEVLHLAASIRTGTVSASVMLKKLAGYSRQNSLSRALREIGRVERSLFMLDWLDDIDLGRRTNANLNKGEARNALARAVFSTGSASCAIEHLKISATGPRASIWYRRRSSFGTRSILAGPPNISGIRAMTLTICRSATPHHWAGSTSA